MMSRIDSRHWTISTGRHFQNGHHNTTKIQHCPISSQLENQFGTSLSTHISNCDDIGQCWIFAVLLWPFWKCQHCPISTPFHMWVDYDVPNWFLTLINFYRSPFSKCPPQYRKNSTLCQDIIIYPHIKLWWYRTMLNFCSIVVAILKMATNRNCSIAIFKMATTIPQKFNIVRYHHNLICG
jgi:hypothetical protein